MKSLCLEHMIGMHLNISIDEKFIVKPMPDVDMGSGINIIKQSYAVEVMLSHNEEGCYRLSIYRGPI